MRILRIPVVELSVVFAHYYSNKARINTKIHRLMLSAKRYPGLMKLQAQLLRHGLYTCQSSSERRLIGLGRSRANLRNDALRIHR